MIVQSLLHNSLAAFVQELNFLEQHHDVGTILIFLPEGNDWSEQELNACLSLVSKPMIGGVFPQIIIDHQCSSQGAVLIGLKRTCAVQVLPLTAQLTAETLSTQLTQWYPDQYEQDTLLVIADGLATGLSCLIDELFNHFGLEINFVGGGAGSLTLVPKPCVITSKGLQQNVAAIAMMQCQSGIGVAHGWEPITEAYRVTESLNNQIISLNWQPAFKVYQQVIHSHSQQTINEDNFFTIAKAYPFGITKLGNELVIRDPITTVENHLICVGDVPQGSFVHMMHGEITTLPLAAKAAKEKALQSYPVSDSAQVQLFIDCISRVLFLDDRFSEELNQAACDGIPMVGALTLGEIANCGQEYLEFYNKTAVVALIKEI
jgi:hypothetical protein